MTEVPGVPETEHLALLVTTMLACGIVGGLVNFWGDNVAKSERHPLLKRLSAGIAAALVVPLFLNMISSSLLQDSRRAPLSLLIFAGFCIIAAISSRAFIDSITKRLINRIDRVEDQQGRLENAAGPVIAAQIEPRPSELNEQEVEEQDEDEVNGHDVPAESRPIKDRTRSYSQPGVIGIEVTAFGTDEDAKKVIQALGSEKYTWRYLIGIAKDTQLPEAKIKSVLQWLVRNGLASTMSGSRGRLWGLSSKGRNVFAQSILKDGHEPAHGAQPQS